MKVIAKKYTSCIIMIWIILYSRVQAEENIYNNYQFTPMYSEQNEGMKSKVAESFETYYSNEWLTTKVKENVEIDGKVFFIGFIVMKDGKNTEFTIKKLEISKQKKEDREKLYNNLFSQVKYAGSHTLISSQGKSLNEIIREKRHQRFYSNGHGAFDYLYCVENQPLFSAPLFKNKPFLFHVTAKGEYTLLGEGFDFVKLQIYNPNTDKLMLSIPLMLVNYQALSPDVGAVTNYYFPWTTDPDRRYPEFNLATTKHQGRKHYAKLFIQDFDNNNKLDIIVWHREYASARRDDKVKKGFYLDKEWFEWHEENTTSDSLMKRELSVKAGHQLLKDNKVWWKEGWPNENRCDASLSDLPYMMYIKDPDIDEPMGKTVGFGY